MIKNTKQTSKTVSSIASNFLRVPSSSVIQKHLAASSLCQSHPNIQKGSESNDIKNMKRIYYSDTTKSLVASFLNQIGRDKIPSPI